MSENTKILPIEPCGYVGKCMSSPSSYASGLSAHHLTPSTKRVADHALQQLDAARAKDIATHQANLLAIENNKAVAARIEALMTEIGMPKSYSERDTKSRSHYPKSVTHEAGWIGDVRRNCKTDDGFAVATSTYNRLLTDYKAYAERATKEAEQASQLAQRTRDAEMAKRKMDMELATMLLRYELPIESDWSDVLEHLRGKDQRLDLAVAMSQTRGDWSEGPYRVRDALDRFQIETTEDKNIANDVLSCLEDFNDGRVFRDTTWSYDALFASVKDQQLAADCQKAMHAGGAA
jgi:hypothetical protein